MTCHLGPTLKSLTLNWQSKKRQTCFAQKIIELSAGVVANHLIDKAKK